MDNILVIQIARMGDFLQTTPLLGCIKQGQRKSKITLLCDSLLKEIVSYCGYVDEVYPVDMKKLLSRKFNDSSTFENYSYLKKYFGDLAGKQFDTIYNLNYSNVAVLLASLPRSDRLCGYWFDEYTRTLTMDPIFSFLKVMIKYRPLSPYNLVDYFCMLLKNNQLIRRLQINIDSSDITWCRNKLDSMMIDNENIIVALQLGTRHEQRRWPTENYVQLAFEILKVPSVRLMLLGSREESILSSDFISRLTIINKELIKRIHDLTGRTTGGQLAAILSRIDLLISCDTGTMHLAAALERPVLAIFIGSAFAYLTGPYGPNNWIVQARLPCSPCIEDYPTCQGRQCHKLITAEAVALLAKHILGLDKSLHFKDENIEIIKTCWQDGEIRYQRLMGPPLEMEKVQNICYRELGKKVLNGYHMTTRNDIEPELWSAEGILKGNLKKSLNKIVLQARLLEDASHQRPYDICKAIHDKSFSFWHPWIDYCFLDRHKRVCDNNDRFLFIQGLINTNRVIKFISDCI